MSASLFSAAGMAVAIPTGTQVFAWIATLWQGRMKRVAPTWFSLAFFAVFVLGGLTGVMLAVVPFDWQAARHLLRGRAPKGSDGMRSTSPPP